MPTRKTPSKGAKPDKIMRDALAIELAQEIDDPLAQGKRVRKAGLVMRALVLKGIDGDVPAIREINDRMDGKVPQTVTGEDGGAIQFGGKVEVEVKFVKANHAED